MSIRENKILIYIALLVPLAVSAVVWAAMGFPVGSMDWGVVLLFGLTILSSCYLRIQLPRLKFHLTISDGLIILTFLKYGGEVAVILSILESAAASVYMRRQGFSMKPRTIAVNVMVSAISVFATAFAAPFVFGSTAMVISRNDLGSFVWMLTFMATTLFLVNSILIAVYLALKSNRPVVELWKESLLDTALMYAVGAVVAGVIFHSLDEVNAYIIGGVVAFFAACFFTYRRFVEDVKKTVEKAKQSDRDRAEEAERHVKELEVYVSELQRSGEALRESHENFRHAAFHDELTGLPNRNFFIDTLKELLASGRDRSESNFAILLLDLNRFKTINDSLGHSTGDKLIKHVADRLSELVRKDDAVARFSGDKFGIILTDLQSRDEVIRFTERVNTRISEPYMLEDRLVFTNVKIGIAFGNPNDREAEDVLRDADIAMYAAKDSNDSYVIFDQRMHIRAVTRLQLETDLRFAIERKEFELYYQPIIALRDASLVGFEALVRWNHPQRGMVPPNEFISLCENTGLIVPMTIQILHSACAQIAKWQKFRTNDNPLSVAVNLSGKHFAHPELVGQIKTALETSGIEPSSLKLELTESSVMENAESAISMLKQIKDIGVQISIDDFGTGYSSLSYLHRFPIDLLKIDRSFVSSMEQNSENGEIVWTVVALAKALKLKVVAEGIESIDQFHQLRNLGCEYGQGYLFSKPLPVQSAERLLLDTSNWQHILPRHPDAISQRDRGLPTVTLIQ